MKLRRQTLCSVCIATLSNFSAKSCRYSCGARRFPPNEAKTWEDTAKRARGHLHHRVRSYTHANAPQGSKTRSPLLTVYSTHNLHACSALKRVTAPCRRNQPAARLHPDRGGHQKRIIEAARTGRSASAVEPDQPALLKPPAELELVSVVWRAVRRAVADLGVVQLRQLQSKRRQVGI